MTERKYCGAKKRQGEGTCTRPAGWGTDHPGTGSCKLHGGKTPSGNKAAQREQAERAVAVYGLPREIDPRTALEEELFRTVGHVSWLETLIRSGELKAEDSPTGKSRKVKLDQAVFGGGDQPSVWVELYQRERKHLTELIKLCASIGVEERRIRLAEDQGQAIAVAIREILVELGVADKPEVPGVVRRHLIAIAGA